MTAGRRPQPTNVKQLHGVRSSRINSDEPMPREVEPDPPEWAPEEWLAIWNRTCTELRFMGLLHSADEAALVCLVTAIFEFDRLARVLVKAPAIVRDANGQPVANPVGRALRQCSAEVSKWCSHFGLTPAERGRISRSAVTPQRGDDYDDLAGINYR
jgi:P27 family predicted phage terminase small subunit